MPHFHVLCDCVTDCVTQYSFIKRGVKGLEHFCQSADRKSQSCRLMSSRRRVRIKTSDGLSSCNTLIIPVALGFITAASAETDMDDMDCLDCDYYDFPS